MSNLKVNTINDASGGSDAVLYGVTKFTMDPTTGFSAV
jgi:hypothetical protein